MNEVQEKEWEECCVCDGEEKGDLPKKKWIVPLQDSFWNSGRMACYLLIQLRLQRIML